jgi:hypothetical protein
MESKAKNYNLAKQIEADLKYREVEPIYKKLIFNLTLR